VSSSFSFKVKSGYNGVRVEVLELFEEDMERLNEMFTMAIESDLYPWDGITRRQNGELAGSPRNIVDTGELRDSQTYKLQGSKAIFEWKDPKASDVRKGRDWVSLTLTLLYPLAIFEQGTFTGFGDAD
jgi:hypothetical protein